MKNMRPLKSLFVILSLLGVTMFQFAGVANAASATQNWASLFSTPLVLSYIIGTGIPLVVGLLGRTHWNPALLAVAHFALSGVTAVLTEWYNAANADLPFAWQTATLGAIGTFLIGVVTHNYVWKPSGASSRLLAVGSGSKVDGDWGDIVPDNHDLPL